MRAQRRRRQRLVHLADLKRPGQLARTSALGGASRARPDRGERNVARLSDNSERLYESDNGVLGRPHRSAVGGRSGASETEMTQLRIDSLSLMYKKSPDPGNFPTASRHSSRTACDRPDRKGRSY